MFRIGLLYRCLFESKKMLSMGGVVAAELNMQNCARVRMHDDRKVLLYRF